MTWLAHAHSKRRCLRSASVRLPEGHPDLLGARLNLAVTIKRQGDLASARALEEADAGGLRGVRCPSAIPTFSSPGRTSPNTMAQQCDLAGARALEEAVLGGLRAYPTGGPPRSSSRPVEPCLHDVAAGRPGWRTRTSRGRAGGLRAYAAGGPHRSPARLVESRRHDGAAG